MERKEKIDGLIEFFEENNIILVDKRTIGNIIFDDELIFGEDDTYYHDELIEKGFVDSNIESLKKFLGINYLMMIKTENMSGISLEHCEYSPDELYGTDLWK